MLHFVAKNACQFAYHFENSKTLEFIGTRFMMIVGNALLFFDY